MSALSVVFFVSIVSTINANLNNVLFTGSYEFKDLTYPFDNSTVYWPDAQMFQFTKKIEQFNEDKSWYASYDFAAGEHGGTHIDAPFHFSHDGKHVGELALENLIVPLILIDVSSVTNNDPNFVLHKHHMDYMFDNNMGKPCVLIFKFGWSKYYYNRDLYLGRTKGSSELNFPGISAEVAEWIVSYKNIVGIGVDVASIDPGSSKDFPVHKTILGAGLYAIENVNLYEDIPSYGCTALALPMKIAMGTGAPLRLVAICPKKTLPVKT